MFPRTLPVSTNSNSKKTAPARPRSAQHFGRSQVQIVRRFVWFTLISAFTVVALPAIGQHVIATIPVGNAPEHAAVQSVTNLIVDVSCFFAP